MELKEAAPAGAPALRGREGLAPCHFALQSTLAKIERFEFYERAKKAFAVVATG